MRDGEKSGLEQIRALVSASAEMAFEGQQRREVYGWGTSGGTSGNFRDGEIWDEVNNS